MHYVIGDIHGYFDELMSLIHQIEANDPDARFILTGDLVDRGPKVMETVHWAMSHITRTGKYQCVLGNHEDMLIRWFDETCLPYLEANTDNTIFSLPPARYDFAWQLEKEHIFHPKKIAAIIDFFRKFPLCIPLSVATQANEMQKYVVVHGWYDPNWEGDPALTPDQKRRNYIWERELIGYGCTDPSLIVVHGHTPTVEKECEEKYYLSADPEPINPGLIAYRRNSINLDGGRPYMEIEKRFCTISAICLETLEEYFADPIPEDYVYVENKYQKDMIRKVRGVEGEK